MPYGFSLSDFEHMTPEERADAVRRLLDPDAHDDEAVRARVNARIRAYESRYEMSSERLKEKLDAGEIRETWDVVQWLRWISIRDTMTPTPSSS